MSTETESDLESRLHSVLKLAFPWWEPNSLSHQVAFSVKLGRSDVPIDGTKKLKSLGRADIIISHAGKHLAVIELKRKGLPLTVEDATQGKSYANLLEPKAPLVIVSNGVELQIYETYTGALWEPKERTELELMKRLQSAGNVAEKALQDAIQTLMGSDDRWVAAIQAMSMRQVADRTGGWDDPFSPFLREFLFPRRATSQAIQAIRSGKRVLIVHGPPLSGKSNVLRELVEKAEQSKETAVLMLEPNQASVFDSLANLLSNELNWKVTPDDAREWLRKISRAEGARLILAIDGIDPSHGAAVADLEDLASDRYGQQLNIVVTLDDSSMSAITRKSTGRERTALGRQALEIPLLPLDDGEFELASTVLEKNRISITPGGEAVLSLREPWALRLLVPREILELPAEAMSLTVRLPPLIDIHSLDEIAEAFSGDHELAAALTRTSHAVLKHYLSTRKAIAILQGRQQFCVAQDILEVELGQQGINMLRKRGFLKSGVDIAGDAVWFIRVPTLMAAHTANALASEMTGWDQTGDVGKKLVAIASKLPFGDITVARAIEMLIENSAPGALRAIEALLAIEPTKRPMTVGSKFAFMMHGVLGEATYVADGKISLKVRGRTKVVDWDLAEDPSEIVDPGGWVILSHLAALPLGIQRPGIERAYRIDATLIDHIGRANCVLSLPEGGEDFRGISVHNIPGHGSVVCHKSGIVEPISWALMQYLLRCGSSATDWIIEAAASKSLPLLTRTHIALVQVAHVADSRGVWARAMLDSHIIPAMRELPMFH